MRHVRAHHETRRARSNHLGTEQGVGDEALQHVIDQCTITAVGGPTTALFVVE